MSDLERMEMYYEGAPLILSLPSEERDRLDAMAFERFGMRASEAIQGRKCLCCDGDVPARDDIYEELYQKMGFCPDCISIEDIDSQHELVVRNRNKRKAKIILDSPEFMKKDEESRARLDLVALLNFNFTISEAIEAKKCVACKSDIYPCEDSEEYTFLRTGLCPTCWLRAEDK